MSMADLQQALEVIEQQPDLADFVGERDERLVADAEAALGLAFPPTYRESVRRLGAGNLGGAEFYGVIDRNFTASSVPDGVWLTLAERKDSGLPTDLIVVGATGDGAYHCLRCAPSGEAPVVLFEPGAKSQRGEVVAEDFGSFLLEQVRAELA